MFLQDAIVASVIPGFAYYKGVLIAVNLSVRKIRGKQRASLEYKTADCKRLNEAFANIGCDISSFANINNATETFVDMVL